MTENKRFTMCHEQNDLNGWTMSIVDWETEQPFDYTIYEVHSSSITSTKDELEDLCLLLNQLNDENEQLKKILGFLKNDNAHDILNVLNSQENRICELKQENEQVKQDKKRLIGFLHRYKGVDVEDVDEGILSKEYLDEWGELYYSER